MTVDELSRAAARRVAVRAQLLDCSRPAELLDVGQLTLLQLDPVAAIASNAHLVAWSRLGPAYAPAAVEHRALLELRAMNRPSEDLALYRADIARWDQAERGELLGVSARLGARQRRVPPGHPGPAWRGRAAAVPRSS